MEQFATKNRTFTSLYSKEEEVFNAVSHVVGGVFGLIALIVGLAVAEPVWNNMLAMTVFGVSIVALYTMSAIYHGLPDGRAKGVMRIFDHCTIYLLIAGTYTPYCMIALKGTPYGTPILVLEWALALIGILLNSLAMKKKFVKIVSLFLYVGMGWMVVLSFSTLVLRISTASLWLLLAGGIVYTVGVIFYVLGHKVKYLHPVWHVFDLVGTALHFASILLIL